MNCIILWINSNSALVIACSTVAYVVFTYLMFREMYKTRQAETRPYIVIDLEINDHLMDIVIQNIGKIAAKDVRFSFDPSLKKNNGEDLSKKGFLLNGFSFFPPKKHFSCFFDTTFPYFKEDKQLPSYKVTVSYKNYLTNREYTEDYIIDLSSYIGREYIKFKNIDDVANILEKIEKDINQISRKLEQK